MTTAIQTQRRTCPICEGMCGVIVATEEGRVQSVRPDHDNVWSRGHICPKGTTLGDLHHDPDRLRSPMIRDRDEWREATWDEAFERCETLIHGVLERHGHGAMAAYLGNMIAKCFGLTRYVGEFLRLARIGNIYSSSTVDQQPKNLSCQLMYGDMWKIPVPDLDNTQLFVLFGGNPASSKGSIFAHRNVMKGLADLRRRGGRVIVVDPVETGTAQKADQWLGIRPGTDAALLLAIVHTLFAEQLVNLRHLDGRLNGLEQVRELAVDFPPEKVAEFCGLSATAIRTLTREIAAAPSAVIYGRIGLCTQEFGTLSSWLIDVVAILTGNLDREGGTRWSTETAPHLLLTPPFPSDAPVLLGKTRVSGAPIVLGQMPAGCFAEEIDTPGEGQIRGLVTVAANPALSAPSAGRIEKALADLECMISVDVYLNETTRHAHVILPTASVLEQPHWDVWAWVFCLTSGGHYSPQLFPPPPGWVEDWEVILRLGALCGGAKNSDIDIATLDDEYFASLCRHVGIDPPIATSALPLRGPERILDLAIRIGPYGDRFGENPDGLTLATFKAAPQGIELGATTATVDTVVKTPSGKIELAPQHIVDDLPRLKAAMGRPPPEMVLVSRRQLSSMNSWMHNVDGLMRGRHRCTLLIHPDDAARLGIADNEPVSVASSEGRITVPAEITPHIVPGVVSLPHGWGHDTEGASMRVASRHAGANSNRLSPGSLMDAPSGNAVVNGIVVTLSPRPEHRPGDS